jgi:DNA-binding PadR family transcriptional regulator
MSQSDDKDLYSGLIRLHILHHAAKKPLFGFWMAEELARHGCKISTGTLYPILHGLENKGYLRSNVQRDGRTSRRLYTTTAAGKRALKASLAKVRELYGELVQESQA